MKNQEIKVVVKYTEGYEKRYTEACIAQLRKRREKGIYPEYKECVK